MKGLEAYRLFLDDVEQCVQSGGIHYIDRKNKDIIEKELKALEAISEAYGNYANHKISEYELIMTIGENTTY